MQEIITFGNVESKNDLSYAKLHITKFTREESDGVDGWLGDYNWIGKLINLSPHENGVSWK